MKRLAMSILAVVHSLMLSAGEKPEEVKPEKIDPEMLTKAISSEKGLLKDAELAQVIACGKEYEKLRQVRSSKSNHWFTPLKEASARLGAGADSWDEKEFSARTAQMLKVIGAAYDQIYQLREVGNGCGDYLANAKDKAQFATRWDSVCTYFSSFKASSGAMESNTTRGLEKFIDARPDLAEKKTQLKFIEDLLLVVKSKDQLVKYKKVLLEEEKPKKGVGGPFPPRDPPKK